MAAILTADTCPSCQNVHESNGGQPGDWPTCRGTGGEHEHWMYVLRGPLATKDNPGGGWTYACQAPGCTHTHTQREKATMTTASEQAAAALAIRENQHEWTPKQVAALEQIGIRGAPEAQIQAFFDVCQMTRLNPFVKQIRLRKDRERVRDADGESHWEDRWSIETEIDGYRVIAQRAAKREGVTFSYGPTIWFDHNEREHKIWASDDLPAGAERTVFKDGQPFSARVSFKSFAKRNSDGNLMAQWAVMPDHMIAIRAESHALRMAFPHDFEGIALSDDPVSAASTPEPPALVQPPVQQRRHKVTAGDRQALQNAIRKEFDRLGLEDHEERFAYVCKLTDKEPDVTATELTERDLRSALDSLAQCADLAALVEQVTPK